jgi:hypothetical protein
MESVFNNKSKILTHKQSQAALLLLRSWVMLGTGYDLSRVLSLEPKRTNYKIKVLHTFSKEIKRQIKFGILR